MVKGKKKCVPESLDCVLHGDAIRLYATQGSDQSSLVFNRHGDVVLCNQKRDTEGTALVVGTGDLILNYGRQFKKGVKVEGDLRVEGNLVVEGNLTVTGALSLPNLTTAKNVSTANLVVAKKTGKVCMGT